MYVYVSVAVRRLYLLSEHNDLREHQVVGQPDSCQERKPMWSAKMSPECSQIQVRFPHDKNFSENHGPTLPRRKG